MPAFNSEHPKVVLVSNLTPPDAPDTRPLERKINRGILVDVAPDREELLTSNTSIEEIRQHLKLRIASSKGHWLYRAQKLREVKLRNATTTTRFSVYGLTAYAATDENVKRMNDQRAGHYIRRRVLSSPSAQTSQVTLSIESRLASFDGSATSIASSDEWGDLALSSLDTLISPRPLGPTHILVVYSKDPIQTVKDSGKPSTRSTLRRKPNFDMVFKEVIEMPINDLLFLLNVPNIEAKCTNNGVPDEPVLPRRLHKELPRVLMKVSHLETVPELIVYLHTLNQAELFRKLIPEWMRDMVHPLLVIHTCTNASNTTSTDPKQVFRFLGQLVPGVNSRGDNAKSEDSSTSTERLMMSISQDIAEFSLFNLTGADATGRAIDPVVDTAAALDALCDNLSCIGYYDNDLWHELDIYRDVLRRAVIWKAKMESEAVIV